MLLFETLRAMLLSFAGQRPEHAPGLLGHNKVQDDWSGHGFTITVNGWADDYAIRIRPQNAAVRVDNTDWMVLHVDKDEKDPAKINSLTLRVTAQNAGKTYQFKFNFMDGRPLEMSQGPVPVNQPLPRALMRTRCFDFTVLDLVELMLPPQILLHRTEPFLTASRSGMKPCILCATPVAQDFHVCEGCRPNKMVW